MYYTPADATREIRRRIEIGGMQITIHATEQMADRDIDRNDVKKCLKHGSVISADFNAGHQDWTYRVSRRMNLQTTLIVVVALPDDDPINLVVTAFWEN